MTLLIICKYFWYSDNFGNKLCIFKND